MNPREYYQNLISSIEEDDIKRIAAIMMRHVGEDNKISLDDLAAQALNEENPSESARRKTRKALELLTKRYHMPVGSNSGTSGRWLIASEQERNATIADLRSRANETMNRIRALQMATIPPAHLHFQETATQGQLW